jgi:hypothetical protein
MLPLQALLDRVAHLRTLGAQLRTALDRLQSVGADAAAAVDLFAADNPAYLRLVRRPAERAREQADFEQQYREARTVAAGHLVYELERAWPALEADCRALREQTKQAPSAITAYLTRTGGHRINLSDETELLIQLLDEQRRARFRADLATEPPSAVLALYQHATTSDSDEAASVVSFVESRHGMGWAGLPPASSEEVEAAVTLRRTIAETQSARVPAELDSAAVTIEQVARLVGKATQQKLHNVTPINLEQHPELVAVWESERPALEQAAREAAERAEHEAAEREAEAVS